MERERRDDYSLVLLRKAAKNTSFGPLITKHKGPGNLFPMKFIEARTLSLKKKIVLYVLRLIKSTEINTKKIGKKPINSSNKNVLTSRLIVKS